MTIGNTQAVLPTYVAIAGTDLTTSVERVFLEHPETAAHSGYEERYIFHIQTWSEKFETSLGSSDTVSETLHAVGSLFEVLTLRKIFKATREEQLSIEFRSGVSFALMFVPSTADGT